jgi:hypothetical protein
MAAAMSAPMTAAVPAALSEGGLAQAEHARSPQQGCQKE